MARVTRSNPRGDLVPLALVGIAAFGAYQYFKSHPIKAAADTAPAQTAAPSAPAQLNMVSGSGATIGGDPTSHAADMYGRAAWAAHPDHHGQAWGYDQIPRDQQVTWNSVAIRGR